ncbi:MAG: ParB N-terminal domain-containing protein [Anaerolineae bacterium]|nr:ParB N-terminal domain-containing protein [Anaerolineae bacterium]
MAKRKISIQRTLGAKGMPVEQTGAGSVIDKLAGSMSSVEIGFRPTDQRVYDIDLDRIMPDLSQPRHLLPHDLRVAIHSKDILPEQAMQELVLRAERGDTVALLILGGRNKGAVEEDDEEVEDTGLLALARSIQEVGLRQPLNVYRIDDPDQPDRTTYRLGEGERRFWAHHLLVQQGYEEFKRVKCIIETMPADEEVIHQRQEAENAARVDLPALARARSIQRIMERLNVEMGTRVPGENTIKLPSQRELQVAVGQRVKNLTGRAISDRMVRNYLALLNLSDMAQDLCEAAQLTEKQLRPVMRLKTDEEQVAMIQRIVDEKLSGRKVLQEIVPDSRPKSLLREVSQTTVEQRFEKRVLDAAKTIHSLLSLPPENYEETITAIAFRAKDSKTKQALQALRQALEEVLLKAEGLSSSKIAEVSLLSVIPPLDGLRRHLPSEKFEVFETEVFTGGQILDQLLAWRQSDVVLSSRLEPFFKQIELDAEALRAGEAMSLPMLKGERNPSYSDLAVYEVESGASIYWAHELLVKRGESQFKMMKAEIVSMVVVNGN